MNKLYEKAKQLIDEAQNVLVISHRKPDADTLGAALCFRIYLRKLHKNTTLACIDKPNNRFSFFPYINEFVQDFDLKKYDLMIFLDAGASYMTNFHLKYPDLFKTNIPILNIDHHASNDFYGKINIVVPEAASTTAIIYKMFTYLGIEIDEKMASCLLAGIYSDTGSFMHSNTNQEVLNISSDLMNKGAQVADITQSLFNLNLVSTLKLWGKVLERAYITSDNVVMSVVKERDYKEANAEPDQLSGIIDYLNMIPDSKFAVLINEDLNGNVKGSFRTRREGIDLSRIAAVFGGGGHPKASGFSMPGRLQEEVHYNIVSDNMSKKSLEF
jgi:phosphoesterase RecJ-like protein